MTTSLAVSEFFWKAHRGVLRDIDVLIAQSGGMHNFVQGYYTRPETGPQQHRMFEMDRDGFTILAMGFTGAEALKFKLKYIAEFNRMEAELNTRQQAPAVDLNNPAALRAVLLGYAEQVIELKNKVEEPTPLAAVFSPLASVSIGVIHSPQRGVATTL